MNFSLDLNIYDRPCLDLTLKDTDKTTIHITTPTVELSEEFRANFSKMEEVFKGNGAETTRYLYNLAAKLINCNLDFIKVTGNELLKKYRMNVEDLILFYHSYVSFIEAIEKAKN